MERKDFVILCTDFGITSPFVGEMKGVISSINPSVKIIDFCHDIPPFSVKTASFLIKKSKKYFPKDSVWVCVVDPGVGSSRKGIVVKTAEEEIFVGPDNGIFSTLNIEKVFEIKNRNYMLEEISNTFHGRDIFAPVSAYISSGIPLEDIGPELDKNTLVYIDIEPKSDGSEIIGEVIYVDRFGNIISNVEINEEDLERVRLIEVGGVKVWRYAKYYSELEIGEIGWTITSFGTIEIFRNQGNVAKELNIQLGDRVVVMLD